MATNSETKKEIADLMSVIPHCQTRPEALEIQNDILELEETL